MNLDETIFYKDHKIAIHELGAHIRELNFSEFMIDYSYGYQPITPDMTCDDFVRELSGRLPWGLRTMPVCPYVVSVVLAVAFVYFLLLI